MDMILKPHRFKGTPPRQRSATPGMFTPDEERDMLTRAALMEGARRQDPAAVEELWERFKAWVIVGP